MNQDDKNENELYLRPVSASICDLFEDLLEEHDITIPSDDREGANGEARLFGDVYYDLENQVTDILAELCTEVKATPDVVINTEDYNGFADEKDNERLYNYRETYRLRAVPKDKIMVAVLDDSYYAEKGSYPPSFDSALPLSSFVFNTPEEFIKKWYELDEGGWYWVFDKGELICSGAIDPGDIELFEEHFDMSFEDNSPALPESITITAATLAVDTDAVYEDKAWLSEIISEYLSDTYGYCQAGFSLEVIYNEFNEPSETIVSNIEWDTEKSLEETSESSFEKLILKRLTEKGFDISQIELGIVDFIDNDHKNCSWYGGVVAEVQYKEFLFSLEARGDINCTFLDKIDEKFGYVKDRNNSGSFRYEMAHCLANDAELYKAKEKGLLVFENNNWFEIFVQTPDLKWQQATWLTNSDDIEECVFEMIETMDEMIEEISKDYEPEKTTDKSLNDIVADATQRSAETNTDKTINTELSKE